MSKYNTPYQKMGGGFKTFVKAGESAIMCGIFLYSGLTITVKCTGSNVVKKLRHIKED